MLKLRAEIATPSWVDTKRLKRATPTKLRQYKAGAAIAGKAGLAAATIPYGIYRTAKGAIDVAKKLPSAMRESSQLMTDAPSYMAKHGETAFDAAGALTAGGFLSKPKLATTGMGFINVEDPRIRASIRQSLAKEHKLRGAPLKEDSIEGLVDDVVRGSWFHGRSTYPESGQTFATARKKSGQLGEPTGISITGKPEVTTQFADSMPDNIEKAYQKLHSIGTVLQDDKVLESIKKTMSGVRSKYLGKDFARVTPLIKGAIKEKILPGWKANDTKKYQKILSDSYTKAAKETLDMISPDDLQKELKYLHEFANSSNKKLVAAYKKRINSSAHKKDLVRFFLGKRSKDFNRLLTSDLQQKGYKGILYSPDRYSEFELKMFAPEDVLMVEKRKHSDKGIARLFDSVRTYEKGTTDKYKGSGRQAKRLDRWKVEGTTRTEEGIDESSLGAIYTEHVDLEKLYDEMIAPYVE